MATYIAVPRFMAKPIMLSRLKLEMRKVQRRAKKLVIDMLIDAGGKERRLSHAEVHGITQRAMRQALGESKLPDSLLPRLADVIDLAFE
jgi:hypothetical protein